MLSFLLNEPSLEVFGLLKHDALRSILAFFARAGGLFLLLPTTNALVTGLRKRAELFFSELYKSEDRFKNASPTLTAKENNSTRKCNSIFFHPSTTFFSNFRSTAFTITSYFLCFSVNTEESAFLTSYIIRYTSNFIAFESARRLAHFKGKVDNSYVRDDILSVNDYSRKAVNGMVPRAFSRSLRSQPHEIKSPAEITLWRQLFFLNQKFFFLTQALSYSSLSINHFLSQLREILP